MNMSMHMEHMIWFWKAMRSDTDMNILFFFLFSCHFKFASHKKDFNTKIRRRLCLPTWILRVLLERNIRQLVWKVPEFKIFQYIPSEQCPRSHRDHTVSSVLHLDKAPS